MDYFNLLSKLGISANYVLVAQALSNILITMNINITKLNTQEKLILINELWESLLNEKLPLSKNEKQILDQAQKEFEKNPVTHSWEDVKNLLNKIVS